ncbi:hypothetical protein TTHERM_01016160 (macronuclear) [Tetrahymena thermophila SB210]|uniref:Uncharacterized protein n=1 Tax=Tetrahymena thermophila (strain SB210) TaxID=312017 RepID=Q22CS5_TETTS|nr:hypothetical protein TTHERM_01016160 [Tetrahymena thermophila SB210]EAR83113.1 hypothetical protein TTHERM_01016160 [Tetrahymena thermophila SB210]|eukprot:XP_001030776.1 hypothetical protein TTHERM_01016160 [Tetrahymena thermophila SB210]
MQNYLQNRSYQNSNLNKILSKKNNQSNNIDGAKEDLSQKVQSDSTFYSPVKYFSNNLKTNNSKIEFEDISPWQTNCEDVLNSTDLDFRKNKQMKNRDKKSNLQNQNQDCCNSSNNKPFPSQDNLITNNNVENSTSYISKTFYLQDLKQSKQPKLQSQQKKKQDVKVNDENIQLQNDNKSFTKSISKPVNKIKEDFNSQLSLSQLEIEQQNKLLQQIRRQRELYIQQMQKTKQLPLEISKTDVTTTPKREFLQSENLSFGHRKKNSLSSQNKSNNIQITLSTNNEIQQQQSLYNHEHICTGENKQDCEQDNNLNEQKQIFKDESITSKNKNKILSILDNALNNQKMAHQNKQQQDCTQKNIFNLSQKASQIQKNLEQHGNNKLKPNQQQQQESHNAKNIQNTHQIYNLQIPQQDQSLLQIRRQSYTQDPSQCLHQQNQKLSKEIEETSYNKLDNNECQNITTDANQLGQRNYVFDVSPQMQSNILKMNKRDNLQSYLLNQQKTGQISNLIQFQQESSNLNNSEIYSRSTVNPQKSIYENVIQQIENLKYSAKKQDKKSLSFIYNDNSKRMSTYEDKQQTPEQQSQEQQVQSDNNQLQNKKNMSLLLPLFKGTKNKEYKRIIKKLYKVKNVSPSQTRRNTEFNNVTEDYSFNSHFQNIDNNVTQQYENYGQTYTEQFSPKQSLFPPIQKEIIPKDRKSNSLLPDCYNSFAQPRMIQYNRQNKKNSIIPYKMMSSYSILDENLVNMIKTNQEKLINDRESFMLEDKQKIDFIEDHSRSNIQKMQDKSIHDSSITPKRKVSENLKPLPQQINQNQNKQQNVQFQKQTEISTKKQKELISQYKPSQLLSSISNYQTQQINITNLSHSKIY